MLESWKARGHPAESAQALDLTLDTAAGNTAIELRAAQLKTPQSSNAGLPAHSFDKATVEARTCDPRRKVGSSQYDPGFVAETDRVWRALYLG